MRTFIAIALPDQIRKAIEQQQVILERDLHDPPIRWVKSKAIHLTLKFLGEISSQKAQLIQIRLPEIANHYPAAQVHVGGLGCFPNYSRPRVIWVGLKDNDGVLQNLQGELDESLRELGFEPEERDFSPHLTIGRVQRRVSHRERRKLGDNLAQHTVPEIGSFMVDAVHLFKSDLKPSGAEYTRLASATLGESHAR